MPLLRNKWLWTSLLGVVLSGGLLLVVIGYLGLIVYSGLANGTPIVDVLLDIAVPVLVSVVFLVALLILSGVAMLWVIVQNASIPRSERIAILVERVEREFPPLRVLGLSEFLSPPEPSADEQAEQALADLKQQYVDGKITEAEFERKVDRLVANESIDEVRAAHERKQVREDTSRSD
jgi:hypothetical protein